MLFEKLQLLLSLCALAFSVVFSLPLQDREEGTARYTATYLEAPVATISSLPSTISSLSLSDPHWSTIASSPFKAFSHHYPLPWEKNPSKTQHYTREEDKTRTHGDPVGERLVQKYIKECGPQTGAAGSHHHSRQKREDCHLLWEELEDWIQAGCPGDKSSGGGGGGDPGRGGDSGNGGGEGGGQNGNDNDNDNDNGGEVRAEAKLSQDDTKAEAESDDGETEVETSHDEAKAESESDDGAKAEVQVDRDNAKAVAKSDGDNARAEAESDKDGPKAEAHADGNERRGEKGWLEQESLSLKSPMDDDENRTAIDILPNEIRLTKRYIPGQKLDESLVELIKCVKKNG